MFTRGLLLQWASTIHFSMLVLYKVDIMIISLKYKLFSPWYSWKITHMVLVYLWTLTVLSFFFTFFFALCFIVLFFVCFIVVVVDLVGVAVVVVVVVLIFFHCICLSFINYISIFFVYIKGVDNNGRTSHDLFCNWIMWPWYWYLCCRWRHGKERYGPCISL